MIVYNNFYGFYFDADLFKQKVRDYFIDWLDKQSEKLIDIMKSEIDKSVAGKEKWREELKANLKIVDKMVTNDYIEYGVGSDFSETSYEYIRAMVVSAGSGSAAGMPAIYAGPKGRTVFDDELAGTHGSNVLTQYDLPDGFNQKGHEWVANAMKIMSSYYQNELAAAWAAIPPSIVQSCLKIGRP